MNQRSNTMAYKTKQFGVSMIELMVAMALGLFVIGGVFSLYMGSRATHTTQGSVASVQESLRFGFEYLAYDIRMAGYMGCANIRDMAPQIVANPPVPSVGLGGSVKGYNGGAGWTNPTAITRVAGTDVISLSKAALTSMHISENSSGSNFKINSGSALHGFVVGQILIVTDCQRSDIFRATAVSATSGSTTITHASNLNSQPAGSNCAAGSGKLVTECNSTGNYKSDAQIASLESETYFIGLNPQGNPALYKVGISNAAEELVEGIFDMQIEYGLDTIDDTLFVADSYSAAPGDWKQVVSVRLTLQARSSQDNALPTATSYTYNGASVSDSRFKQASTTVIGLRNLVQ
jgi:type IV pilus assembly protein PilW